MRKLRITQGRFGYETKFSNGYVKIVYDNGGCKLAEVIVNQFSDNGEDEAVANSKLIADAFNTANKCDMLPSELLELVLNVYCSINQYGTVSDSQKETLENIFYNE